MGGAFDKWIPAQRRARGCRWASVVVKAAVSARLAASMETLLVAKDRCTNAVKDKLTCDSGSRPVARGAAAVDHH